MIHVGIWQFNYMLLLLGSLQLFCWTLKLAKNLTAAILKLKDQSYPLGELPWLSSPFCFCSHRALRSSLAPSSPKEAQL